MKYSDAIVLVFSKAPVAGKVNTRLTPYISHQEAADLHRELVHNRLDMLVSSTLCEFQLWCAPDVHHPFFDECANRYGVDLMPQSGVDLGERMSNACRAMLDHFNKVIIIGTDAPALGEDMIEQAISELDAHDAVMVPAEDGGYVLLGLSLHHHDMLMNVAWGSGRVLEETTCNLERLGLHYCLLGECWDVDRPEDLERYRALQV